MINKVKKNLRGREIDFSKRGKCQALARLGVAR